MTNSQIIESQHKMEKALVFKAGLDLAYIATGFYLKEKAKNTNDNTDRFQGYGESLLLQGGFLFFFDVGYFLVQKKHGAKLFTLIKN